MVLAALAAGCGGSSPSTGPKPISLALDFTPNAAHAPIYITGDTVWFDGVAEVARRFPAGIVIPFAGAAETRGPFHLTMDTNDAI